MYNSMKYLNDIKRMSRMAGFCFLLLGAVACSDDWDGHYDDTDLTPTSAVQVYQGDVAAYLASQSDLSNMSDAYRKFASSLSEANGVTVIAVSDADIESSLSDATAKNLVSDIAFEPASLVDGNGIYMLSGKNLWITEEGSNHYLNSRKVTKIVKADNGYIYYVDGFISVEPSIYEYIQSLDDENYSLFKALIAEFEERYFDASASTPSGVDAMGNTIYSDSVIAVRNTLMDRYTENGLVSWNMRSEAFQSTVFIPSNDLIRKAYYSALDSIPVWLNRAVTPEDSLKFRKWMLAACFSDRRLSADEVAPSYDGQYTNVGGYVRETDDATDTETFKAYDAAQWKPSVQIADYQNGVTLSNGTAYFLSDFRIPNHIVIYRAKARFYQTFAALTPAQQGWNASSHKPVEGGYFKWINWRDPLIVNDAQGPFELSSTLPTMYYHVLTAVPTEEAFADTLPCAVEYVGLYYNTDRNFGLAEVRLPAGEYYLRMGFKHSLRYSLSIYFGDGDEELTEDNICVKDMSMIATGSNFHFDRGGAMEGLDFYGSESIGYGEYFDWRWWYDQDPDLYQKASAYDTDGYQVATVTLKKPGNFKIRVQSNDMSELYMGNYGTDVTDRSKNNVYQLMMYHWCLRPTTNNY